MKTELFDTSGVVCELEVYFVSRFNNTQFALNLIFP